MRSMTRSGSRSGSPGEEIDRKEHDVQSDEAEEVRLCQGANDAQVTLIPSATDAVAGAGVTVCGWAQTCLKMKRRSIESVAALRVASYSMAAIAK